MKAWILISFYLLKDIWRRWFETPGGVLSRLLVAFLLGLLLLVIDASFTLSAASIQQKISQMGIRTILLTRTSVGAGEQREHLANIIAPLSARGTLLRLRQLGVSAEDEFGQRRSVYVYGNDMLAAIGRPNSSGGAYLISDKLPEGMVSPVQIDAGAEFDAVVIPPPSWLAKFGANPNALLLPVENSEEWLQRGFFEVIVFLGNDDTDLPATEEDLRILLELEDLNRVQLTSPKELLRQLDKLESTQRKWQGGFGLFGGLAVSLVFGSIAVLEYRQNRFIIALLRSFGTPSVLLIARYLVEATLLVALAILLARGTAISVHPVIFQTIGIEPTLIDRGLIDPYAWQLVWGNLKWLGLGAFLSILPVALALRTPVGKILA